MNTTTAPTDRLHAPRPRLRMPQRAALYAAANGVCGICGEHVAFTDMEVDHILPLTHGGEHAPSNWQIAHRRCTNQKGRQEARRAGIAPQAGRRLGNRLREHRYRAGETLRELAGALGWDYSYLSRVERGLAGCSDDRKVDLALHFGVAVTDLFFVEDVA